MQNVLLYVSVAIVASVAGCEQQSAGTSTSRPTAVPSVLPDESPATYENTDTDVDTQAAPASDRTQTDGGKPGRGMMADRHEQNDRGPGHGRGRMGEMREDMTTLHALFDGRSKITRTITNLPNGAETVTESSDDRIAGLLQEHVPAMEGRVADNTPLPPMTFHPLFIELIRNADKVAFEYNETDHGIKVTYTSDDPHVVLVIQEHAKLVSRFIENGMQEIHKPYTLPDPKKPHSDNNVE